MRNNRGAPHDAYFAGLQRALRDARVAEPAMVLDLDRLDRNAERVRASLPAGCALRLVAKSLPSPELLAHLMDALGTRRQMVFHAPFIAPALRAHIEVDVLLGKPLPVAAANRVLDSLSDAETRRVRWLVDDLERLHGYLALGARTHLAVDDTVFFRPLQSESTMLQFGAPVVVRGGRVVARWSVLG